MGSIKTEGPEGVDLIGGIADSIRFKMVVLVFAIEGEVADCEYA